MGNYRVKLSEFLKERKRACEQIGNVLAPTIFQQNEHTPVQTSPEVRNWGISDPTKRTCVLQKLKKLCSIESRNDPSQKSEVEHETKLL